MEWIRNNKKIKMRLRYFYPVQVKPRHNIPKKSRFENILTNEGKITVFKVSP